ncbi:restriction endonuclease [bacterium]|nr:restriction endonuclease [bacterium]
MLFSYKEFLEMLNSKMKKGKEFYIDLLKKIIDNPSRYYSIFRTTSIKQKLIQNITQSHEIKFGNFIEYITTKYLEKLGYTNLNKEIHKNVKGDLLKADQIFMDNEHNKIYLVEQKIRDDHDSTKKRGQYENFDKKINLFKKKYPKKHLTAIM